MKLGFILVYCRGFRKGWNVLWSRVGATGLTLSLRKPARETSGHQILFQYSWAFPWVLSLWLSPHLGIRRGFLPQTTRGSIRLPELHMVVRCWTSLTTFSSGHFKIIMTDNSCDLIFDLWCACTILGTWIKQLLDPSSNPVKFTLSSSLSYG